MFIYVSLKFSDFRLKTGDSIRSFGNKQYELNYILSKFKAVTILSGNYICISLNSSDGSNLIKLAFFENNNVLIKGYITTNFINIYPFIILKHFRISKYSNYYKHF